MAVVTTRVDDLDNTSEAQARTFALEGVGYEIDLSDANYKKLVKLLTPYTSAAREITGTRKATPTSSPQAPSVGAVKSEGSVEVRAWARANGYDVSDRGRVPTHIVEAFRNAH